MKRYQPTSEDIAMLQSTQHWKVKRRFLRRWFKDNKKTIASGIVIFAMIRAILYVFVEHSLPVMWFK